MPKNFMPSATGLTTRFKIEPNHIQATFNGCNARASTHASTY
jgi:hypothetical protein